MKISKNLLIAFAIVTSAILLIPAIFYICYFAKSEISSNPHDWGVFGDYFGGTLNPTISILNCIILGYLTYFIYKNSNEDTKSLFYLQQRISAFQNISLLSNNFELFKNNMLINRKLTNQAGEYKSPEDVKKYFMQFIESLNVISEAVVAIRNFERNYGHLFKYNFDSPEYKDLQGLLKDYLHELTANETTGSEEVTSSKKTDIDKMVSLLNNFLNNLKKELE